MSQVFQIKDAFQEKYPMFSLSGNQIDILYEPEKFYDRLLDGCRSARHRIVLSSLYLGIGPLCRRLVDTLVECLQANADLRVHVLLDAQRGTRTTSAGASRTSSCHLLAPLLRQFPTQVTVSLYHSPKLRGWRRWLLPQRVNEVIGLQHMKVYIFDNDVIISGANLNDDYFSRRQDRYVCFNRYSLLADFYAALVATVGSLSFRLTADNRLELPATCPVHPYLGEYDKYVRLLRDKLLLLFSQWKHSVMSATAAANQEGATVAAAADTWLFPTVNLGAAGVHLDQQAIELALSNCDDAGDIWLASGYFNVTERLTEILVQCAAGVRILCAHPTASGFMGASGLSGLVPDVYTQLLRMFYQRTRTTTETSTTHAPSLHEYRRPGWTFHSKGLWRTYQSGRLFLTAIGSSNYGYRSAHRDLESQVVILTENESLQRHLYNERNNLYLHSTPVDDSTFAQPDRLVPYWVRLATRFIRGFF